MNDVIERMKKLILDNSTIVVSCSGGPDSMALLSMLNCIKKDKNLNIIVGHVNHKVRKESDDEAIMVENYAKNNDLKFELYEINTYHEKVNFHEDARKIRYKFIKTLVEKYNAKYIMTAHHGDDLTETILMRLTRGSDIKGYIGFSEVSEWENITLLRPLITKTKKDLIAYDEENNIPYAIDKTNFSDDYTRNRYRNNIIPLIKKEDETVHLKYLKFSNKLAEYYEYVKNSANKSLANVKDDNDNIIVSKLVKLQKLEVEVIVSDIIRRVQSYDYLPVTDALFTDMLNVLNSDKSNVLINLPNNYLFGKEYDRLVIKKMKDSVDNLDYTLNSDYIGERFNISFTDKFDGSNYTIALNSSEIKLPLKIRYRKTGDKMEVLNLNGKKKINDIFINAKIKPSDRDTYPILTDSVDNIIWIPGIKKSKFAKKNTEKYDIILNCEEKKNESKK